MKITRKPRTKGKDICEAGTGVKLPLHTQYQYCCRWKLKARKFTGIK
jgi:hypothetical protein